jgi:hypothetical protein
VTGAFRSVGAGGLLDSMPQAHSHPLSCALLCRFPSLQIDTLFITHLHGDHCFGIGTMLVAMCKARKAAAATADHAPSSSSSSSSGYDSPSALRIVGPPRLGELVSTMLYVAGVGRQLDQPVYITEFVEIERCACLLSGWGPGVGLRPMCPCVQGVGLLLHAAWCRVHCNVAARGGGGEGGGGGRGRGGKNTQAC